MPSSSPATTASTRCVGTRSSGRSTAVAWASNAARNASTSALRTWQPAAARCPPWRARCSAHACSPPSRSNAGIERPEPVPASPSSATSTHGRWWRSAMREATIPMTPGCQPSPARTYAVALPRLGDHALGLEEDALLDVAALGVRTVELLGDHAGALGLPGEQELDAGVRAIEATRRVEPRREPEADRAGVDARGVRLRHLHEGPKPLAARGAHRTQAGADEPPVLPAERHAVGDRGERDELEVLGALGVVVAQRAREHVRDARAAELGARVARDRRVDERCVGQQAVGARAVVVGDDDVHPRRARRGDLVDRGDPAVHGDEQPRAAGGEALDRRGGQAVAVLRAAREEPADVGAQLPQRAHEDRGRRHPVDVVVAVDRDPPAVRDVAPDERRRLREARERREVVAILRRQPCARSVGIGEAAADEHLREDAGHAELALEAQRRGDVAGVDLQAGCGQHSPPKLRRRRRLTERRLRPRSRLRPASPPYRPWSRAPAPCSRRPFPTARHGVDRAHARSIEPGIPSSAVSTSTSSRLGTDSPFTRNPKTIAPAIAARNAPTMPPTKRSGTQIAKCQTARPIITQARMATSDSSRDGGCGGAWDAPCAPRRA